MRSLLVTASRCKCRIASRRASFQLKLIFVLFGLTVITFPTDSTSAQLSWMLLTFPSALVKWCWSYFYPV